MGNNNNSNNSSNSSNSSNSNNSRRGSVRSNRSGFIALLKDPAAVEGLIKLQVKNGNLGFKGFTWRHFYNGPLKRFFKIPLSKF